MDDKETDPKGSDKPTGYEHLKDSMGRFRTLSLFVEHKHDSYPAPFTLKDYNHKGAMSMYLKYMEYSDPTEYSFALGMLGSWKHWELLTSSEWFSPYVTQWRKELKQKLAYERFQEMLKAADKGNIHASKWLDERFGVKPRSKRGRPSKAEKAAHLKEVADEKALIREEAERLGIKVVK